MSEQKQEPDWKAIAASALQRLDFAMRYLKPRSGSGAMFNSETGEITPWRKYIAEAMEMWPGVTVDWDVVNAYELPPKKMRARLNQIAEEKKKAKGVSHE